MQPQQQPELIEGRVRKTPPGLVALRVKDGVAFQAASFSDFIAAHVDALPAEERAEALAWLTGFGTALADRPARG